MAGGMFRESKKLKGKGKGEGPGATPLPPPVSSEQYRGLDVSEASPANGSSKEEDHFGFLYSVSEKDFH